MTTDTAAIYVRISNDKEGLEFGVQRQEEDCRKLADRLGFRVTQVYRDNDIGASAHSRKRRPDFERLMEDARGGQYRAILAYSHSRLTRRPMENESLLALAEDYGIRISTVASGEYDLTTGTGKAVARTVAAWDGAEAAWNSERVARAARQRAEAGLYHGGPVPPFGYQRVIEPGQPTRLVPDPDQSKLLNEGADRLLAGDRLYGICNDWNDRGLTTSRGKHWRSRTLSRALTTRSVLGETSAGVKGWKPIIEQKKYDKIQRLLSDPSRMSFRATSESRKGKRSMGGGLTVCAGTMANGEPCGKNLVSQMYRGKPRLICHRQATGGCGKVTIPHDELEAYVFELVLDSLRKNKRWQARLAEPVERDDRRLSDLEDQRAELVHQAQRANDAFIRGLMDEAEHTGHVSRIQSDRQKVEQKISQLLGQNIVAEAFDGDVVDWKSWTPIRRRNFVSQLIARVEVERWPAGHPSFLAARRGESQASVDERNAANRRAALEQRVRIVPR